MKGLMKSDSRRIAEERGFTLIEILIVMVILAILAGIVIISVGGVIARGQDTAYTSEGQNIQTAVLAYFASNNSTWPTIDGTAPNIIDIGKLLCVTTWLPYLDKSATSAAAANCGLSGCTGCAACTGQCQGSYVWWIGSDGVVFSKFTGTCSADTDPVRDGCNGWQLSYP